MISRSILPEHLELVHTALVERSVVHTFAVVIAGVFVLMALALSTFLMFEHLTSYKDPEVWSLFLIARNLLTLVLNLELFDSILAEFACKSSCCPSYFFKNRNCISWPVLSKRHRA